MGVRLLEGTESIFGGAGGTTCPVLRKWLAQSQIDVIDPELGQEPLSPTERFRW